MRKHIAFRTMLVLCAIAFLPAGPVYGACDPAAADGVTATCSGDTADQNAPHGYGTGAEDDVGVTILQGATVTGTSHGIFLDQAASVSNHGTVTGGIDGIQVGGNSIVRNYGTVFGNGDDAIEVGALSRAENYGELTGTFGIFLNGNESVAVNYGTITTTAFNGIVPNGNGVSVYNYGTITSADDGIYNGVGGNGFILNAGTINAVNEGITITTDNWTIINTGEIVASGAAIEFSHRGTLTNSGTLIGNVAVDASGAGVIEHTVTLLPGSVTTGTSTVAINLGSGNDQFYLAGGTVNGLVFGGAGNDAFVLSGDGTSQTLDIGLVSGDAGANCEAGEQFCNFETFLKDGTTTWTLTGSNDEIGTFAVEEGRLNVNATMATTAFNVAADGILGGTGTVGDVVIDGTGAPGNSIGTLNVANLTFNSGSVYEVEVSPSASDLFEVDPAGATVLNGGMVVVSGLNEGPGTFVDGQSYVIINSPGGVAGTFNAVADPYLFLDFSLNHAATQVRIDLTVLAFSPFVQTPNQTGVAGALDNLQSGGDADTVRNAFLLLTEPDDPLHAFELASGEIHASAQEGVLRAADLFASTLKRRAGLGAEGGAGIAATPLGTDWGAPYGLGATAAPDRRAPKYGTAMWAALMGETGDIDGDGNAAGLDTRSWGFAGGLDLTSAWAGGTGRAGVAGGFINSETDVDALLSSAEDDSAHVGIYGALEQGALLVRGAAAYAHHDIDTTRGIVFPGLSRTASAGYDGDSAAVEVEAMWRVPVASDTKIAPLATLDYLYGRHGRAVETGAGALNLSVASESIERTTTGLGLALLHSSVQGAWRYTAEARAIWEHSFGDVDTIQTLTLAGAPGSPFVVAGPVHGRNQLAVGLDLGAELGDVVSLGARYDGAFLGDATSHQGSLTAAIPF